MSGDVLEDAADRSAPQRQRRDRVESYGSAYRAFYYWGIIEGDSAKEATAVRLHDGQQVGSARHKADASTGRS